MNFEEYKRKGIFIGIPIILIVTYILYISDLPWDTHESVVAYHSILALLATTAAAACVVRTRMDPSPSHKLFYATMVYASTLHVGSSIMHFYLDDSVVAHLFTYGVFFDIFEMLIISILLIGAAFLKGKKLSETSVWNRRITVPGTLVLVFILTGLVFLFSELGIASIYYLVGGYVMGTSALAITVLFLVHIIKDSNTSNSHDPIRLAVAGAFVLLSTTTLLIVLPSPTDVWLLSLAFQAGAYIYFIFATAYPFLIDVEIDSGIAYALVISMLVLAVIPFVIGQVMMYYLSLLWYKGLGATVFIHIAASLFLTAMGFILYLRNNKRISGYQSPIIFMIFAWAITEFGIVLTHFNPVNVNNIESTSPFIIGGLITVVCLLIAIRRILTPSKTDHKQSILKHIVGYLVVALLLVVGEMIQWNLYSQLPALIGTSIGESIILLLCYTSFFEVVFFIMLLAAKSGGQFTFEFLAVGSQSIWIVSLILKADFLDWTAGWWAADGLIGICVLLFPLVLVLMFRIDPFQVRNIQNHAAQISHLLSKDISEFHQSAISDLNLIGQSSGLNERELDSISVILTNLSYADNLIRHMGSIIQEERFQEIHLEQIDLVDSIAFAFARAKQGSLVESVEILIDQEIGKVFVEGNSLLSDLFYYLFVVIASRILDSKKYVFNFRDVMKSGEHYWLTQIQIELPTNQVEEKKELMRRYITDRRMGSVELVFVKTLIHAFWGRIEVVDTLSSELVIEITLPKADMD